MYQSPMEDVEDHTDVCILAGTGTTLIDGDLDISSCKVLLLTLILSRGTENMQALWCLVTTEYVLPYVCKNS